MDMSTLNILAILVAAVSSFVIGGMWYSPAMFGKAWMVESGLTEEDMQKSHPGKVFGFALLASLVIAFNMAMFLGPERTLFTGTFYGFLTGFGWVAMAMGINDLFEQRSFKLYLINAGYHVVAFTVIGAIIGAWH
jgi:hypothetical protein